MSINPEDLGPLFKRHFGNRRLVVVSNREPYEHRWSDEVGEMDVRRPAGGLTSALDPLMQALGGMWVAWGSGEADAAAVDGSGRVKVPPENPAYTLRRVWLTHHDIHRYYLGFSNQFLWPLCHLRPDLTRVRSRYWERYRRVNRRFAEAVLEEVQGKEAAIWFQDYHLALAPLFVRARRPDLALAHFWHIPFPPIDIFRLSPHSSYLLRGLLANDLMGFHLPQFADNFLRCARRLAGAEVDFVERTATLGGHTCHVGHFPISIDVEQFRQAAVAEVFEEQAERLRQRYAPPGGMIGIGVDRLDYSKGLPEKFKALEFLWDRYPEYRERFTFIQVAVPTRSDIEAYDELAQKVDKQVWEINERFGTPGWRPIHLVKQSLPAHRLAMLYRLADVCIISSLQDGMNLVAKEFAASQVDGRGVLLLSEFAGAAEEMAEGATLMNPYDPEACALKLRDALTLPVPERQLAMRRLQEGMKTIYDWMGDLFTRWGEVTAAMPETRAVPPADEVEELFAVGSGSGGYSDEE
ncbi:MAG TPA: trehalose-6-phosphate synthase [Longimicrobiaceae bacterium]|nr:trehalose-6-phosphate synthase [Longimicrobiaceae bacterium]